MKKQLVIYFLIILFLGITTTIVVLYGRGYRFIQDGEGIEVAGTGLLAATSIPEGAGIYVNGHLTSATNTTVNLRPGEYDVRIVKEGYFPWEKKITIQKEVVSIASALLFSTTPKLENITDSGVSNPVIDPSGTQIAFTVASQSARRNGVYILDMSSRPVLTLQSSSTQISDDTSDIFSQSLLSWSPDGKELIATISASTKVGLPATYIVSAERFNQIPQDVTQTIDAVNLTWQKQKEDKERSQMLGLKAKLRSLISENFKIISWSPNEAKILYLASESATLPLVIDPPLIGTNTTAENRSIEKDGIYVYDIKEDKNFQININPSGIQPKDLQNPSQSPPLTWFPDSKHLIFVEDRKINIMEYDGTNKTVVYAGPFMDNYVFPWPDGSKLVILTNLGNENITPNLYTIGLK
ncbi:MAG: hypothetical protein ACD_50C00338G0013 [uncultured bacterium]|nr:MAG: hypothetical protein ACD_50C00338G0013 [uncultured bacterium]OGH13462.1 MAG: hypothetical protein A2687_02125 [Candidatus Levybacteria bacterium RIFCSPHIGHO2_01_FULL_38_26]